MFVAYGSYGVTKTEALNMLKERKARKKELEAKIQETGYPAYAADGWTRCKYWQMQDFSRRYKKSGFDTFKVDMDNDKMHENKISSTDIQSCFLTRRVIGWRKRRLIIHMNHALTSEQARVALNPNIRHRDLCSNYPKPQNTIFKLLKPYSIENVMSHENAFECYKLKRNLKELTKVCIGEMCSNYAILKKQTLYINVASDVWLMNVARMSGINEVLAMYFWAEKVKSMFSDLSIKLFMKYMLKRVDFFDMNLEEGERVSETKCVK